MSRISQLNKKKRLDNANKPKIQYTDQELINQYMNLVKKLDNYDDNKLITSPNKDRYIDIVKKLDIIYNELISLGISVKPYHNRILH